MMLDSESTDQGEVVDVIASCVTFVLCSLGIAGGYGVSFHFKLHSFMNKRNYARIPSYGDEIGCTKGRYGATVVVGKST